MSAIQQLIAVSGAASGLKSRNAEEPAILSDHLTSDGPPLDAALVPEAVVLKSDRLRLEIAWGDGNAAEVSATRLRAACRCAWCTRARIDGTFAASFEAITIDRLTPVGDY